MWSGSIYVCRHGPRVDSVMSPHMHTPTTLPPMSTTVSPFFHRSPAMIPCTIGGNASDELKRVLDPLKIFAEIRGGRPVFGKDICARLQLLEVSMSPMAEEPTRQEGRIVCTTDVADGMYLIPRTEYHLLTSSPLDMVNGGDTLHGGCVALLVDMYVRPSFPSFPSNAEQTTVSPP